MRCTLDHPPHNLNKHYGKQCTTCGTRLRYNHDNSCAQCRRMARKVDAKQTDTTTMLAIDRYNFERSMRENIKEVWE